MTFLRELKFAARSLARAKGLTCTVAILLALGIGANAAIFSLVRAVLLRPLANRDANRLVYIRQSAPGIAIESTTFSVPEIQDLRGHLKTFSALGDFSTTVFTMIGLGEPHEIRAGIVGGSYFEVMGLRPILGRLIGPEDDGPNAMGTAVLAHRFWVATLKSDPSVVGKTVRLGSRSATVIGVLEPSVPYPAETEIFANVVTSPHHLSATMAQGRAHRMTELFGRLAPGATFESALADLRVTHAAMMAEHPEAYASRARTRVDMVRLRDQITSKARVVLILLLSASSLIFLIACANVANLILARTIRREGELAIRKALGASYGALRRSLFAESLLLCGLGAALGILIAQPMVTALARYASRFSVRALDLTVDSGLLWTGAALALVAAVFLAFVPRLPSGQSANGHTRVTGAATRRLQGFATIQIAASFLLLLGAAALLKTLVSLQSAEIGIDTQRVLALNVPVLTYGRTPEQIVTFYRDLVQRVRQVPGVDQAALGTQIPWRDAGSFGPGFLFSVEGHAQIPGEQEVRAQFRTVSPGFFGALGTRLVAGRDFNDLDRSGTEPVVIISQSLAQRMFPHQDALNRRLAWTDPIVHFIGVGQYERRIIGIAADIDDEHLVPRPAFAVYQPFGQEQARAGRLFVRTHGSPYALVAGIRQAIRELSADQPVERVATLADIRGEALASDRLNTLVFGGFAILALSISVVGVGGVIAFSVSTRTREFGIRLALGAEPRQLVRGILAQGMTLAALGVAIGATAGFGLLRLAGTYLPVQAPGVVLAVGSAVVLLAAALAASRVPAVRAARVDVVRALRAD